MAQKDDPDADRPHTELRKPAEVKGAQAQASTNRKGRAHPRPRSKYVPDDGKDIDGDDLFNDMPV